jgi:SAM-dependent methyltransferase
MLSPYIKKKYNLLMDNFEEAYKLVQKSYENLWQGQGAHNIDFGDKDHLDIFYKDVLKTSDFKKLLKKPKDLTVLDLGAGRGSRLARYFAKKGAKVIALDCIDSFDSLKMRYKGEKLIGDITETGLEGGIADLVISAYTTLSNPYFEYQEVQEKYILEIIRLLKAGGIFWGEEKDLNPRLFHNQQQITNYAYQDKFYVHFFKKI